MRQVGWLINQFDDPFAGKPAPTDLAPNTILARRTNPCGCWVACEGGMSEMIDVDLIADTKTPRSSQGVFISRLQHQPIRKY
jgi:hypothetical protein